MAPQLDYAPRNASLRRRRVRRWLPLLLCMAALSVLWFCRDSLERSYSRAWRLYIQHRCLNYTIDPRRVVYEENAEASAALLNEADYRQVTRANGGEVTLWDPRLWDQIWPSWPDGAVPPATRGLLFLHECRNELGEPTLISVHARIGSHSGQFGSEELLFEVREMIPGDAMHPNLPGTALTTSIPRLQFHARAQPLTLYGGQADPLDPSHFTIRYRLGDTDGTIDGYVGSKKEAQRDAPMTGLRLELRPQPATKSN